MGIKEKISKLSEEAARLERIRQKFPDLDEARDRWGTVRLTAKSANAITTDVDTRHSCGCCNDAPYYAQPYLTFEGMQIFSNPERICIGEKSTSYYGHVWDEDWREKLRKHDIPETVIAKLETRYEKDRQRKEAYDNYQEDLSEID